MSQYYPIIKWSMSARCFQNHTARSLPQVQQLDRRNWKSCQDMDLAFRMLKFQHPILSNLRIGFKLEILHLLPLIMKFRFGCGQELDGDFGDGMLGLGRGESSVTSQMALTNQMFSYFIPNYSNVNGNLYFGKEAREIANTCSNQFTPLVKGDEPVYYYVDLVGISVGGKKLNVPSIMFTSKGTIIDSGTVITRLPEVVYSALRAAFRQSMLSYTLINEKVDDVVDTCYRIEVNSRVVLPDIKFHFGKVSTIEVTLSKYGTIWTPPHGNRSIMCLAFAAAERYSIIGSVQQRGLNVIYDLEGERIGFGTNCQI